MHGGGSDISQINPAANMTQRPNYDLLMLSSQKNEKFSKKNAVFSSQPSGKVTKSNNFYGHHKNSLSGGLFSPRLAAVGSNAAALTASREQWQQF